MDYVSLITLIKNNWLTILSLTIAFLQLLRTQKWKRLFSIQLNVVIDDSHSLVDLIKTHTKDICIINRTEGLNHRVTHLIGIVPSLARKWLYINKKESDWPTWEQKLLISMDRLRLRIWLLKLLKLK